MSEIRLTDDDKDRKYRIRINEKGEEELEILQPEEQPEEEEELLDFQTDYEDGEEENSEETLALMRAAKEEQARLAREEAQSFIAKAKERIQEGDTEFALVALDSAQKSWDEEWEIYTLKLELLTKNFTDFSRIDECVTLEDEDKKFVPDDVKEELRGKYASTIKEKLNEQQKMVAGIRAENEEKKSDRRVKFKRQRNIALRNFMFAFIPFILILGAAIGFNSVMMSDREGTLAVVTIVLYSLAAVLFIVSIVLLRPLMRALNRLSRNEKNTSTAIGRTYIEGNSFAEDLNTLYAMIMYSEPQKEEQPEYATVIDGEVSEI